ncbi:MAG: lipopolysaccharide kinase InaA family protein [Planctomycetota bacterium]
MIAPPGFRARTRGAETVWLREGAEGFLAERGLDAVAVALALPGEARGRLKSLVRLEDPPLFVKRWHFDALEVALRGALKLNVPRFSAFGELANLLALQGAGFRVPAPLAAGEERVGSRRRRFVALAELAGAPLASLPDEALEPLAAELGATVRRLHDAGFCHRDLYLENVFWDPDRGLGLLDCERVFRRRRLRRRWVVKDLAALASSARGSRAARVRFWRAYCRTARPTPGTRALARWVLRKAERLRSHGLKGPRAD